MVPHGLNVGFNTTEDNFSIGPRVLHFCKVMIMRLLRWCAGAKS